MAGASRNSGEGFGEATGELPGVLRRKSFVFGEAGETPRGGVDGVNRGVIFVVARQG